MASVNESVPSLNGVSALVDASQAADEVHTALFELCKVYKHPGLQEAYAFATEAKYKLDEIVREVRVALDTALQYAEK